MMRILDRLEDTAAQVVSQLGETLRADPAGGRAARRRERATPGWRAACTTGGSPTRPSRLIYPEEDHPTHSRLIAANLHGAYTRDGKGSRAAAIVDALLAASPEFAAIWREHPVAGPYCAPKRIQHPQLGLLELHCQTLVDPDQSQALLVYTAAPGSETTRSSNCSRSSATSAADTLVRR